MKLSEKAMNVVKKESETVINQMAEGKTAIEIASEIYCKALPDKNSDTGKIMAKRIDRIVCEYECNVKSALEDSASWVKTQVEKQIEGKELEERCKILFSMLVGVSSLNDVLAGEKSSEEIQHEYAFNVEHVSEEYEESLKERLIAAVQASTYGSYQLKGIEKALENGNADISIGDIINFGKREHDIKVIMAMIAYVNAKNGTIENLPTDISMDEVTIAVVSSCDIAATAAQVDDGEISTEKGAKILNAISTIASFMIAAVLTLAALGTVGILIDLFIPRIIGIPLIIVAGVSLWGLFNVTAKKCVDVVTKFGAKVIKNGCSIIKSGAKKLSKFIAEHIAPKASEIWNKVKCFFIKLKEEYAEVTQEEKATTLA